MSENTERIRLTKLIESSRRNDLALYIKLTKTSASSKSDLILQVPSANHPTAHRHAHLPSQKCRNQAE